MNATEMKQAFLIRYDAIASNVAPGHEDEEISYFLSEAERDIAVDYGKKYESDELVRKKLENLLVTSFNLSQDAYSNASDIQPSTWYEVPDQAMRIVRERFIAQSSDSCIDGMTIKVVPILQDEVDANYKRNPFYTPNYNMIWRLDHYDVSGSKKLHQIITPENVTPKEYGFIYLKYPTGINTDSTNLKDSDLDSSLHSEVIEKAVRFATSTTKPELYQITGNEEQLNSELD